MNVELINEQLLADLIKMAKASERLRQNYDLRTTPNDTSQRMLNALEVGTDVPIHRHESTSETVVCIKGCMEWVFYDLKEGQFVETSRFRLCPAEGVYGIQVPMGEWHTVHILEPSIIFEAKDGAYLPTK